MIGVILHAAVLAETVTKILALVTAFDEVSANQEAMEDAALQFDGLLQVESPSSATRNTPAYFLAIRISLWVMQCSEIA